MAIETTKAIYVTKLLEVLAELGAPCEPVLEAAGQGPLISQDRDLPISDYLAALEAAVEGAPDVPDLGFRVGSVTTLLEHGVLGYALLSSPTLRDCLQRYVRYQYLQGPLLSISLEEADDTAALVAEPRRGRWQMSPRAYRYLVQEWLIAWNQLCQSCH